MGDVTQEQAYEMLVAENEAMEKEIMALTKGDLSGTAAASSSKRSIGGIQVLKFGNNSQANEAGIDNGSSWCPPQCSRRTVLGGFFTS